MKCSDECLGLASFYTDVGVENGLHIFGDASAALGIIKGRGLGLTRHMATSTRWLQQKLSRREIGYERVDGQSNVADLLATPVSAYTINRRIEAMCSQFPRDIW